MVERLLLPFCDATIVNNDAASAYYKKRFGHVTDLVLWYGPEPVHPDMKLDILSLIPDKEIADRCRREKAGKILHIGYLRAERGIVQLIDSMEFINNSVLIFLGPDISGRREFERLAGQKQWADRILFLDAVPWSLVTRYAASCDVGAMPLQNKNVHLYLNSPNKLFECLMAGIPVVVSDFPVMGKLVRDYDVGEVVDETDPREIAAGIRRLLDDPDRMDAVRRNIPRFQAEFSWQRQSQALLNLYQRLFER